MKFRLKSLYLLNSFNEAHSIYVSNGRMIGKELEGSGPYTN
jgi:hypothetical protein